MKAELGTISLKITHHAIERMVMWHPGLMVFAPRAVSVQLQPNEAYRVHKVVKEILKGLARGVGARLPRHVRNEKTRRYDTRQVYVYDEKCKDFYTMVLEGPVLTLVTVSRLHPDHQAELAYEPRSLVSFGQIDLVRLPYTVVPGGHDKRFLSVELEKKKLPVFFGSSSGQQSQTTDGSASPAPEVNGA